MIPLFSKHSTIRCPKCKKEYDVTLFEFGREIICDCANRLGLRHEEIMDQLEEIIRQFDLKLEEEKLSRIKNVQERIAVLIMNTDYQKVDIEIEKSKFKELIKELFPEKAYLYELIYEPRCKRFWEQFREKPAEAE